MWSVVEWEEQGYRGGPERKKARGGGGVEGRGKELHVSWGYVERVRGCGWAGSHLWRHKAAGEGERGEPRCDVGKGDYGV